VGLRTLGAVLVGNRKRDPGAPMAVGLEYHLDLRRGIRSFYESHVQDFGLGFVCGAQDSSLLKPGKMRLHHSRISYCQKFRTEEDDFMRCEDVY